MKNKSVSNVKLMIGIGECGPFFKLNNGSNTMFASSVSTCCMKNVNNQSVAKPKVKVLSFFRKK